MNFVEFYENVQNLKNELMKQGLSLEDVQISYTKFDGKDCIWALDGDNVVAYFKW